MKTSTTPSLADRENAVDNGQPTAQALARRLPVRPFSQLSADTLQRVGDVIAANLLAERDRERGQHDDPTMA